MLKTFEMGGIHPPEEKISSDQQITYGEVPEKLLVTIDQHIGKPCEILVDKGNVVERGQLIAKSTGFVSSNVHSPVNGKVDKIVKFPQLGGQIKQCALITPENPGEKYSDLIAKDPVKKVDIQKLTPEEIRKTIADAGIVGMGGAGFPTHVKLSPPPEKTIDTLIINGAECEPYITSDHRVMLERSDELIKGILILQRLFDNIPVFIGIERNKRDAIEKLEKALKDYDNINVAPLLVKYPQGGEKQLIKAILDREVPSKGLPMDVGVVVQNVATILSVHNAFYHNRPLMERVVTISGNLVNNPGNIVLPVGTPISYVMEKFGIDPELVRVMISGGPMMGRTSYSFESPVTKTTSALLFFDESRFIVREENPCIRCGSCINACPMGLAVAQYTEMIKANNIAPAIKDSILDCIECGSCSYVCPADRRLVHWMRLGKNIIRREN
ncbi:MAG: electron transport complex subunit RsxC [Calditrichaceae bacterium]|jgi:electron transport complex protein RnfC